MNKLWSYENRMVVLLCLTIGVVFFDRNAINFLMPFIAPDLALDNTQIGMLASGLSLAWALSGLGLSVLIDATGHRRIWLVTMVVVFSFCSVFSGVAASFVALLASRVVMGLAEGPILPIAQSFAAIESSEARRGLNMGIIQNLGGGLLGQFVAPLVVVGLATIYNWKVAFFITAMPGLILSVLLLTFLREPVAPNVTSTRPPTTANKAKLVDLLRVRNVWLCCLISCMMVSWLVLSWVFMPLYLVKELHLGSGDMSMLMSICGVSAAVCGAFVASGLSDRIGRKPVMIIFCMLGMLAPLSVLFYSGSVIFTAVLLFIGTSASGTFPVFMATIPSESIPARYLSTSIAMVVAIGEIVGGVSAPLVAGWAADAYGLASPLFMQVGLAATGGILSLFLLETSPRIILKASLRRPISA